MSDIHHSSRVTSAPQSGAMLGRMGSMLSAWMAAHAQVLTVLAIFFGFLMLRLPFRSAYPVNWDAVQFGLGVQQFDIHHHQPHPPGYIGYIAIGKLVNAVVGDPHASLTLISVVAGAIASAMLYPLARRFMSDNLALIAAVSFGASTLAWYYSEVALTYIVEVALILPFLFLMHRALTNPSVRDLIVASGMLAVLGSFRQTSLALMLPLWGYVVWRYGWGDRIRATGVLGVGVLLWMVPLLWLSGGPVEYINASRELAELTGGSTSIFSLNPVGMAKNFGFVMAGILVGVNVVGIILLAGRHAISGWIASSSRHDRMFFLLWALPALAVYLLGHTGQIGYILMLIPIPFIALGIVLPHVAEKVHQRAPRLQPAQANIGLVALLVVANLAGFLALPPVITSAKPESVELDVRQFDLRGSDAHWREVTDTILNYPADSTVVLTTIGGPRVSGSYRHLSYMLPKYHIYGLGHALENGVFGPLFHAYQGRNNYRIGAMHDAGERLDLPMDARYIIIPDEEIAQRLEASLDSRTTWTDQRGDLTVIVVEPGAALVFSIRGDIITFSTCDVACVPASNRAG